MTADAHETAATQAQDLEVRLATAAQEREAIRAQLADVEQASTAQQANGADASERVKELTERLAELEAVAARSSEERDKAHERVTELELMLRAAQESNTAGDNRAIACLGGARSACSAGTPPRTAVRTRRTAHPGPGTGDGGPARIGGTGRAQALPARRPLGSGARTRPANRLLAPEDRPVPPLECEHEPWQRSDPHSTVPRHCSRSRSTSRRSATRRTSASRRVPRGVRARRCSTAGWPVVRAASGTPPSSRPGSSCTARRIRRERTAPSSSNG